MASSHHLLLTSVLQPSRLLALHALYFAWADSSGLPDAASLLRFFSNDIAAPLFDIAFASALIPLSTIPLDEVPPLLPYLVSPADPAFPPQALGLLILLDQAPRFLLRGIDERWTFGHFGGLALRFAQELAALPVSLQPQRVQLWQDLGYGYEHAWLRAFLASTPFIHAEDLGALRFGQALIEEECRKGAETHYGVADSTRPLDETDTKDVTLFPKLVLSVQDRTEELRREEAQWRMCRIVRVHEPIIASFGRYPYRNGKMGRENTEEELEFLKKIGGFGDCDPETARKIREDVEAGRWTPL
ncbi:MAG: hypothetical protein Q9165_001136 [Trypethelium subeluteriae]